jgi:hypothetical protein
LGLLAGSILTLLVEGGFGTLAGGRLETFGKPYAEGAAGALVTPVKPGAFGSPGAFGRPSTGALGNPPLVFGLLAALTLTLFVVEVRGLELTGGREDKGLELTGGREDKGLELTGGRDETEDFGLGSPAAEGEGLTPETALFGFEAADTAVFLTAPA